MKKILCLLLCIVMTATLFASCDSPEKNQGEQGNTAGNTEAATAEPTPEPTPVPDDETIARLGLENVGREVKDSAIDVMKKDDDSVIIYVKDYGAVGDGVTNDQRAISKAINALKKAPNGSTLEFEANTEYYCGSSGSAITLGGLQNRIIKGNNTTILIDAPAQYLSMTNCKNIVLQGFNYNYKKKPYAFTVSVDDVDTKKMTATVTLDRSLDISRNYSAPHGEFFGVVNRDDGRYHMGISSISVVDADKNQYKITFNSVFSDIKDRLEFIKTDGLIVPMPNVGHCVEQAFTVMQNTNITLKDSNVWSACKFMFFLKLNEDKVLFENFNVVPDPAENGGNIRIVGWRDGFHCKENRAQLIWKDCRLEWVYDDVFNISASLLSVEKVTGSGESAKIDLIWPETGGEYGAMKKGDVISFYDSSSGKFLGKSAIKRVSAGDVITLENEIDGIKSGVIAAVNSLGAPNSQLINCKVKGTIRFRSPMYIVDSEIHCTRMWIGMETPEGPVTENILFSNSKITFDNDTEKFLHIVTGNNQSRKIERGTLTADEAYHVKNIIFRNCEIDRNAIELDKVSELCNDVIIFEN